MKAIVIGATGTIGHAVRNRLEREGYEVIGASRKSEPGVDIGDENSVNQLFKRTGNIDVLVCAAGNAAFNELFSLSDADFNLSLNNKLMGQVKLLLKGLSYLNPGGTILLTGGIYAYEPVPGSAAIAMVNAGLEGFVRAASIETGNDRKIIVVHPPLIAETAKQMGMDPTLFLTADEVSDIYLEAIRNGKSGEPYFAKNKAGD